MLENDVNLPHRLVDSRLKIKESSLQAFVADLVHQCSHIENRVNRTIEEIIIAHNQYVTYIVSMLNFVSGHRAVTDPYHDSSCFFPEHKAFIITDKVENRAHEGRIVWLGDMATQ